MHDAMTRVDWPALGEIVDELGECVELARGVNGGWCVTYRIGTEMHLVAAARLDEAVAAALDDREIQINREDYEHD